MAGKIHLDSSGKGIPDSPGKNEGAATSTVNKEKAALSKMFQVLIELRHVDVNPANLVKNLSERSGEREVYLSLNDVDEILDRLPQWDAPSRSQLITRG
jgi:hypothetical protein